MDCFSILIVQHILVLEHGPDGWGHTVSIATTENDIARPEVEHKSRAVIVNGEGI